jgi:tetratricopeptide (TPR) repeat protein
VTWESRGVAGSSACPEAERLAEYAENRLAGPDRTTVEHHLVACADCRSIVAETAAFLGEDRKVLPFFRRGWGVAGIALSAAAALLIAVRLLQPYWTGGDRVPGSEFEALVAAAAREPTRAVEGRLTGGFGYAPARPVTRSGPQAARDNADLLAASVRLQEEVAATPTAHNRHALGIALLVVGEIDRSIEALDALCRDYPSNARVAADLGAAYLARASATGSVDDLERARTAVDSAISLDAGLAEAWFNRALIAGRAADREQAAAAWDRYLALDPDSPWAAEARERRQRLQ